MMFNRRFVVWLTVLTTICATIGAIHVYCPVCLGESDLQYWAE
jgi:hypothetical protein